MKLLLLLLFPFVDLYLLFVVSGVISAHLTIFLVVFSGVLGYLLIRHQGTGGFKVARVSLQDTALPQQSLLDGPLLVLGGILLMVPGFISDIMGLSLLIPAVRTGIFRSLLRSQQARFESVVQEYQNVHKVDPAAEAHSNKTIEGEYKREDQDNK